MQPTSQAAMSGGSAVRAAAGERGITRSAQAPLLSWGRGRSGNAPAASAAKRRMKALTAVGAAGPPSSRTGFSRKARLLALHRSSSREGASPQGRNPSRGSARPAVCRRACSAWSGLPDAPDCLRLLCSFQFRRRSSAASPSYPHVLLRPPAMPVRSLCRFCVCPGTNGPDVRGLENKEERR